MWIRDDVTGGGRSWPRWSGGCATAPTEPESEKLDPDTATTITVLTDRSSCCRRRRRAKQTDPFAYVAPFETNRMGSHELFLWVSTPQAQGQLTQPQVIATGSRLSLQPLKDRRAVSPAIAPRQGTTWLGAVRRSRLIWRS